MKREANTPTAKHIMGLPFFIYEAETTRAQNSFHISIKAAPAVGSSTVAPLSFSRQQLVSVIICQFFTRIYLLTNINQSALESN